MPNPPLESIKKTVDFKNVYKFGSAISDKYFVVYVLANDKGPARLGLSIGKKVGGAVVRNKLRRRVKEFFRLFGQGLGGVDIVVAVRSPANEIVNLVEVKKSLFGLVKL